MLELVDLDKKLPKKTFEKVFSNLEPQLGDCQRAIRIAGVPVVIVFEGWDAAGKGTTINHVAQALDPRGFKVHPTVAPTKAERARPWMWRFWNALPAAGNFAIFDRSWYGRVLRDRIEGLVPESQWRQAYEEIAQFERQLADSGVVLVKFWLHISRGEQRRRFKGIRRDPATAWRVGKQERKQHKKYKEWLVAVEEMLQRTDRPNAAWTIVEATQERFVRVKVFETILRAVEAELHRRSEGPKPVRQPMAAAPAGPPGQTTILDRVDLTRSLSREEYEEQLAALEERLFQLEHRLYTAQIPAVIVYEGWDAAGKGGNIRRLTRGLDPRGYEVIPVGVPTAEELAHHYLWRFWRQTPKAGHIAIFDRSWYGRVLVERVEGLCPEPEWRRAFTEINEFEHQLVDFGTVVAKFWLHIDQEEQLRRFQDRRGNAHKQWKITEEDWRNREKWDQYSVAVVEMLERTSTTYAPWTILEANCKLYARVKALRTVADALERALDRT
jgi:polyphosphate:AMP phosphotransferase